MLIQYLDYKFNSQSRTLDPIYLLWPNYLTHDDCFN